MLAKLAIETMTAIQKNLRNRYRGVPLRYRPLDSSNEEEAELISLMKACA